MNRAASSVNGSFWHGRRIMCNPRLQQHQPKVAAQRPRLEASTSLYVGNIPYETTDAELNRLFRDLDNIKDVRVAVDRVTGWPRGFAHADFTDVRSAQDAHQKLQGATLGSRALRIDFADSVASKPKTTSE
jgi:nucleolin